MIWLFSATQLTLAVSRAASPGLPDYIRALLSRLAVFSFESAGFHPACAGGGPFSLTLALFAIVTVVACTAYVLMAGVVWAGAQNTARGAAGASTNATPVGSRANDGSASTDSTSVAVGSSSSSSNEGGDKHSAPRDAWLAHLESVPATLLYPLLLVLTLLYPAVASAVLAALSCEDAVVPIWYYRCVCSGQSRNAAASCSPLYLAP